MEVHISIAAEELFSIGPIGVTNSMATMFVVMALLLIVFGTIARRASMVPGRMQSVFELIIEFLLGMTEGAGGKALGRRIFPLVSALFIFILFANYSGLLPGVGTIGIEREVAHESTSEEARSYTLAAAGSATQVTPGSTAEAGEMELVPFMRPPTADLNMTLALALVTFMSIQIAGIRAHGVKGRIKHLATPPFLFPIEVISEFSRIISLSARLFGNVFAGEVLLAVMYTIGAKIGIVIIPVLVPVVFLGLEFMFGTIQAMVFAILTLIYISVAAAHHDADHHEPEAGSAASLTDAAQKVEARSQTTATA